MSAPSHPAAPDERTVADIPKNASSVTRVRLCTYQGARLCDARVYVQGDDQVLKPSKKGLCVRVDQLAPLITALEQAQMFARQMGWLDQPQRKAA